MTHIIICDVCGTFLGPFELFDDDLILICTKCAFDNTYQVAEVIAMDINPDIDIALADTYIDDEKMLDALCQATGATREQIVAKLTELNMLDNILNEPEQYTDNEL